MKYVITESQCSLIMEEIPLLLKRRYGTEYMKEILDEVIADNPDFCDEFWNGDEYADEIISYAVLEIFKPFDFTDLDTMLSYNQLKDKFVEKYTNEFFDYLKDNYHFHCDEVID
jgi:hypothetical protein